MTAAQIKAYRVSMNLTQEEFAALLGTRQATVSDWERGRCAACGLAVRAMQLLTHAHDLATDLAAVRRGANWNLLCAAPSEPALVLWEKRFPPKKT